MYAPSKIGEQPSIEVSKEFMLKPNKIHLEASLDKEVMIKLFLYFHVSHAHSVLSLCTKNAFSIITFP